MQDEIVKIVVFVPESHADTVRDEMGKAGAGKMGKYAHASFSTKGIGRFRPLPGAQPTIGKIGKIEEVLEERIETVCFRKDLQKVIAEVKKVHPYEEVALDVYPLIQTEK